MSAENDEKVARLHLAFELFELGVEMKREQLKRANPAASSEEIDRLLGAWMRHRPGAEHGDAEGRPVAWPLVRKSP